MLCILDPYQILDLQIFCHSLWTVFSFLISSFEACKFLILVKSSLSVFSSLLFPLLFVFYLRRFSLTKSHTDLLLNFLLCVFITLALTLRFVIHVEFIFVCVMK